LTGAFAIILLGAAALAMLAGPAMPAIGWVGLPSLFFISLYLLSMRTIFRFERSRVAAMAEQLPGETRLGAITLRRAISLYSVNAAGLVAAATFLPGIGERLAAATGLAQSFVGSLFIATSTSLPELVVSVAAMRLGALDMAAANLLGSSLFNIAVLGLDDVLYTRGPLLSALSETHAITAVSAMMMTAVAIVGLTYRAQRKRFRLSWDAVAMIGLYAVTVGLLWRAA
jgi:cation:H+ antiporter